MAAKKPAKKAVKKKVIAPVVHISLKKGELLITADASNKRFEHHGFGTFLCDVKKGEISITKEALDILLRQPERRGLQGLEFWRDKRMAWCHPSAPLSVPPGDVNLATGAASWVKSLCTIVKEA
jgi:hypothetical protein